MHFFINVEITMNAGIWHNGRFSADESYVVDDYEEVERMISNVLSTLKKYDQVEITAVKYDRFFNGEQSLLRIVKRTWNEDVIIRWDTTDRYGLGTSEPFEINKKNVKAFCLEAVNRFKDLRKAEAAD